MGKTDVEITKSQNFDAARAEKADASLIYLAVKEAVLAQAIDFNMEVFGFKVEGVVLDTGNPTNYTQSNVEYLEYLAKRSF